MPHTVRRPAGLALLSKNGLLGVTFCIGITASAAWLDAIAQGIQGDGSGSGADSNACGSQFHPGGVPPDSVPGHPRAAQPRDTPECRGKGIFFDETLEGLGGNGRACSTCHVAQDGFQLTPHRASARLRALQQALLSDPTADDGLFRPIDADDFRVNGDSASDYTTLTQDGLVRITLPLPANVRLVSPVGNPATAPTTDETTVDIWRSVPSILDVGITGPDDVLPEWTVPSPNRRANICPMAQAGREKGLMR